MPGNSGDWLYISLSVLAIANHANMAANQGVLNQGAINPLNAAPAEVSGYKSEGQ